MVCIPCFIIPAVLFIWYKFLQPFFLKFWNPFGKVEDVKKTDGDKPGKETIDNGVSKDGKEAKDGCPGGGKVVKEAKEGYPGGGKVNVGTCPIAAFAKKEASKID